MPANKPVTPNGDAHIVFCSHFATNPLDRSSWSLRITGGVNDEQRACLDSAETAKRSCDRIQLEASVHIV